VILSPGHTHHSSYFDGSISLRLGEMRLGAGGDVGQDVDDNCVVINSPEALRNCHQATLWRQGLQIKINGSYPLPHGFVVSAVFQIMRAHARGLAIFGATLLPYEGTIFPGYYSPQGDDVRQKFNGWLRTSNAYDGVIDFDVVMRDPSHPTRMLPQYDSGDHLHPDDTGYATMARSVDLALLNGRERGSGKR
jgi:hypothetical protein